MSHTIGWDTVVKESSYRKPLDLHACFVGFSVEMQNSGSIYQNYFSVVSRVISCSVSDKDPAFKKYTGWPYTARFPKSHRRMLQTMAFLITHLSDVADLCHNRSSLKPKLC